MERGLRVAEKISWTPGKSTARYLIRLTLLRLKMKKKLRAWGGAAMRRACGIKAIYDAVVSLSRSISFSSCRLTKCLLSRKYV